MSEEQVKTLKSTLSEKEGDYREQLELLQELQESVLSSQPVQVPQEELDGLNKQEETIFNSLRQQSNQTKKDYVGVHGICLRMQGMPDKFKQWTMAEHGIFLQNIHEQLPHPREVLEYWDRLSKQMVERSRTEIFLHYQVYVYRCCKAAIASNAHPTTKASDIPNPRVLAEATDRSRRRIRHMTQQDDGWAKDEVVVLEDHLRRPESESLDSVALYSGIASELPDTDIRTVARKAQQLLSAVDTSNLAEMIQDMPMPPPPEAKQEKGSEKRKGGPDQGKGGTKQPAKKSKKAQASKSGNDANAPDSEQAVGQRGDLPNGVASGMARLDENVGLIQRIRENLLNGRIHENVELMITFRNNIKHILKWLDTGTGPMTLMPALPVKLNTLFIPSSTSTTTQN